MPHPTNTERVLLFRDPVQSAWILSCQLKVQMPSDTQVQLDDGLELRATLPNSRYSSCLVAAGRCVSRILLLSSSRMPVEVRAYSQSIWKAIWQNFLNCMELVASCWACSFFINMLCNPRAWEARSRWHLCGHLTMLPGLQQAGSLFLQACYSDSVALPLSRNH